MKGNRPNSINPMLLRNYQPQNHQFSVPFQPYVQGYQQANNYYYHPFGNPQPSQLPQQGPFGSSSYFHQQGNGYSNDVQQTHIFQNPLQPAEEYQNLKSQNMQNHFLNPYPPQAGTAVKPQQGGVNSLMNSFKSQDGSLDFNKMVNTAGQMMNAVNQVSTMVKGLGGLFKS
ncbi:YppG family protein [Heyndrickxia sporothermodurans]|uniref:YppG family protein n=1 Tax=Heyndrickxia sporothermodurans TaxID=46224 RepID=UPI002DBDC305|nr:YppG family protein [Heyndrickxia sporothermodurans]MEB6547723.1 YppG family protein [Heyndrickxia sporothermodurans]MED3654034.1 YppG family protein [Heyndrickxia sporothermodurans]MED3780964.1 YppG family protein [Heyndrickxia sporothermodurans]